MGPRAPLAVASAVAALVVAPTLALGEGSAAGQADDPASPSFDLQGELREEIEDELERAAERQSWLAGDAAREQREQTLTAFADLGAAEAREALVSEFRNSLDSGEPASPVSRREVAEYLDPHTALLEVDGSTSLTESALPLLAAARSVRSISRS